MNPGAQAGVWIPLDQLLALPLPAEPLASLWRELLRALPPAAVRERQALEQALQAHELRRVEALCEAGEIEAGLSRLEALAAGLEPTALAALLHRLMPGLHRRLIREAGPKPAPEVLADPQRTEQLWLADQWMRRLEALPSDNTQQQQVMAEQICRHAVLAWMAQPGDAASGRAISLLQRLLQLEPKSRNWALPAIRERLLQGVQALNHPESLADPQHLGVLLEACAAMGADPQLPEPSRQALELAVFRGRAALDVWQNLERLSAPVP
jgi:hypothetical protein